MSRRVLNSVLGWLLLLSVPEPAERPGAPACAAECVPAIRELIAKECVENRVPVMDVHISHLPLLVESSYQDLGCTCPHGVVWHIQPTSEQIARWVEDGVE